MTEVKVSRPKERENFVQVMNESVTQNSRPLACSKVRSNTCSFRERRVLARRVASAYWSRSRSQQLPPFTPVAPLTDIHTANIHTTDIHTPDSPRLDASSRRRVRLRSQQFPIASLADIMRTPPPPAAVLPLRPADLKIVALKCGHAVRRHVILYTVAIAAMDVQTALAGAFTVELERITGSSRISIPRAGDGYSIASWSSRCPHPQRRSISPNGTPLSKPLTLLRVCNPSFTAIGMFVIRMKQQCIFSWVWTSGRLRGVIVPPAPQP